MPRKRRWHALARQPAEAKGEVSHIGTPVTVRLQPDLLSKLDRLRGGKTRPRYLRELLEEK